MEFSELLDFFHEKQFVADLKAKTKEEALNELAEVFVESQIIRDKAIVLDMLHSRESIGSTAIGSGIAIPHGRTTAAPDLSVAFGKSKDGIPWEASDNKPVHLIFMVVAPPSEENNLYLPMLGKLVEFLHEPEKREKLLKVETFEDFKSVLSDG